MGKMYNNWKQICCRRIYIQVFAHVMLISAAISTALFSFAFITNGGFSADWEFLSFIVFLPIHLINLLLQTQYIHYLNVLRKRYILLNEYLEALAKETDTINNSAVIESSLKKDSVTKKVLKSFVAISDPIFIVEKVAELHIKLSSVARLINGAFSVQLLVRITVAFISIVSSLFLLGMDVGKSKETNSDLVVTSILMFWATASALEVTSVVWITSSTCEEANKCPRWMHKIRNNTTDVKLQNVIEMYSLQMFHNRLQFYVCGLFPLDYTLLHTIVAGATTYLVILVQFSSADTTALAGSNKKPNNPKQ